MELDAVERISRSRLSRVAHRMDIQLGLRRNELARRCGFKNVEKGLRRIDGVCRGDLDSPGAKMVLDNLAVALEVDKAVVENAITATAENIAEANRLAEAEREAEALWRSCIAPHPTTVSRRGIGISLVIGFLVRNGN